MDASEIWERLTDSSRLALGYAAAYQGAEQRSPQQQAVYSENLLRGLIATHPGYSEPEQLLEHLGLPIAALEEALWKTGRFITGEPPKEPIRLTGMPDLSRNSLAIVETALKLAEEHNPEKEKLVRARDLFGGILLVEEPVAHRALAQILEASSVSMAQTQQTYPDFLTQDSSLTYSDFLRRNLRPPIDVEEATDDAAGTLTGHQDSVFAVAIAPDGRRVISASSDKTLKLWGLESYQEITTLTGHKGEVYAQGCSGSCSTSLAASRQPMPPPSSFSTRGT
jgi:hypothetical protein